MTLKATCKKKIFEVKVERLIDDSPDTSYLGEYADKATSEFSIDRKARGEMGHNELRYFNPSFNYVDKQGNALPGYTDDDVRKNVEEDYRRMESLNAGQWQYLGIRAVAKVGVSFDGGKTYKTDQLTSGGLWGIESDSDAAYLASTEQDELNELKSLLTAYGFGRTRIAKAIAKAERE